MGEIHAAFARLSPIAGILSIVRCNIAAHNKVEANWSVTGYVADSAFRRVRAGVLDLRVLEGKKKAYNPFTRYSAPRMLGALADNTGIAFYSYAMARNSASTDPLIAVYPVFAMFGGCIFMKERAGVAQYALLFGIVAGSVMVAAGTVF